MPPGARLQARRLPSICALGSIDVSRPPHPPSASSASELVHMASSQPQIAQHSDCYVARSNLCNNAASESTGSGLFAAKSCAAHASITQVRRPLVAALDPERTLDTCANCFIWTAGAATGSRLYVPPETRVKRCQGCLQVAYCSQVGRSLCHVDNSLSALQGLPAARLAAYPQIYLQAAAACPDR